MNCEFCGKYSKVHSLCIDCYRLKEHYEITKCRKCNKWYKTGAGCECMKNDNNYVYSNYYIGDRVKHYSFGLGIIKEIRKDDRVVVLFDECGEKDYARISLCNMENITAVEEKIKEKYKIELSNKVIIGKDVIDKETKDIRKKWEAGNRCDDGHYVRSYSEMIIDNWLYNNGYLHAYEKKVFMATEPDEPVLCDFYLPKGDVYIEFWGKDNDRYIMRRERKIQLYKDNNYNVINIEPDEIKIIGDILQRKIFDYIKSK